MVVWKKTAGGIAAAVVIFFLIAAVYSAIAATLLHFTDLSELSMEKWHGMTGAAAVLIGSTAGSAYAGQKGMYIGCLTAGIVIAISLLFNDATFEWSQLIHYGLFLACGITGGIIGVNVRGPKEK
ncbi:hypothetical protein KP77_03400 [Jeotgalibacillus alimentarius]|uniref:TIGR04086 family membrane protein n=1 Tax=Jeotgalibacillus alimentarius TaxID=135826 RepID=A0A0C2SHB0_9BACL|nr:TIGR04086 family membrane protein [Jeotgalibacillus alimentarius]KIL53364.1 hypothetical protein KP77_03400 [Jeotgalibacillus alimentarius]